MSPRTGEPRSGPDPQCLLLIVVGANLEAELGDRPLAARLRTLVERWQAAHAAGAQPLRAVICTDLWYLNSPELMVRPAIAVGRPQVNAATAWLANRLPAAFVVQGTVQVQLDPEFARLQACVWGVEDRATALAVDLFAEKYLDAFLRSAHGLPAGSR